QQFSDGQVGDRPKGSSLLVRCVRQHGAGESIGGTADCSNPTGKPGAILYNADYDVMQYCNGKKWVGIGHNGGPGGPGCSNPAGVPGLIIYNYDHDMMQYCDGDKWIRMSEGDL